MVFISSGRMVFSTISSSPDPDIKKVDVTFGCSQRELRLLPSIRIQLLLFLYMTIIATSANL